MGVDEGLSHISPVGLRSWSTILRSGSLGIVPLYAAKVGKESPLKSNKSMQDLDEVGFDYEDKPGGQPDGLGAGIAALIVIVGTIIFFILKH